MEKAELVELCAAQLPGCAAEATALSTCAICYEEGVAAVRMPCCGVEGSSIAFCRW